MVAELICYAVALALGYAAGRAHGYGRGWYDSERYCERLGCDRRGGAR